MSSRQHRIPVLHFSNAVVRGGAEEHILTLLRGLDRKYFRLHLVCTPAVAESLRSDVPPDVEVAPLCLRKPHQWVAALRLARLLRARKIAILHSHLFYGSLFASPIGWLCGVPVIVETPHVREQWRRGPLKSRYTVDRLIGRFVDRYIAVSEANARYLSGEKGLPVRKVVVIRNGCDLTRFHPDHRPPPGLKSGLGFADHDQALVVVGRLEPQKGHRVLLDALPAVRAEFPRTRLVCVGDGPLKTELKQQACALGLAEAVRFVGYKSKVPDWLALADIAVLPSFYEGLPLAALEALAAGKPMVATAVDGTPEIVLDGKTGLTVPPGDPVSLAGAIRRLLRDAGLRARLGRAGREWVLERFSQERQVRQTEELYLRVWEHKAGAVKRQTQSAPAGLGVLP